MRERIGILGWGRFGRALGGLFAEAGHAVCAWDEVGVTDAASVGTVGELASRSDVVVLAVPIGSMRQALEAVAPHAGGSHLVMDVGSVKTQPVEAMAAVLGERVPWVGSHPLFGPTSLTLGERPLRVVLCASAWHPSAVGRARSLYEGIGCEVVEQQAGAHDRAMAETHALAYFVAKGMLDSGMRLDAENAPPSSQAILRTVEAVRSDAGHLFAALHLDNPYAPEVRRRFLAALQEIDRSLDEAGPESDAAAGSLAIPDLGERSPEIREVRDLIDDVDRELIALLGRRAWLSRRAGQAKAGLGVAVRDPRRESELLAERREWARAAGIDADGVESLFHVLLGLSRRLQTEDRAE